ncbi:MAG: hypothetical protein GQ569_00920 [Methylococcaceae bacterium]|nr:hypothetical protein [Methylococcaceae bacterium]
MKKIIITAALVSALSGCASHKTHWSYAGNTAPQHWGSLSPEFATCGKGKNQSPIDIQDSLDAKLPPISFSYSTKATEIVNNGHTIQVNIAAGSYIQVDGQSFELKQFHFHTPSENEINSQSFPLEAHFVHADDSGNLAVVAVMFKQGEENSLLKTVLSSMPSEKNKKNNLANMPIDYAKMLPSNKDYYRYNGSLTTPPCSEGVRWLVFKNPVSIIDAQTQQFETVLHHGNNRPTQPLNARIIIE